MKFNVHAGHTKQTGRSPGASGYVHESIEDRKIKDELIKILKGRGHTVYDCTYEGLSCNLNLWGIVRKCNKHKVDLDISIHLNCSNGQGHGTECHVYSRSSKSVPYAKKITDSISKLGFTKRELRIRPDLAVLRKTNSSAVLIETLFCDNKADCDLYKKVGAKSIAKAIADAVAPASASPSKPPDKKPSEKVTKYKVVVRQGLNVRKSPKTGAVIKVLPIGTVISTTKEKDGWVYCPSHGGWLCKKGRITTFLKKI